MSLSQIYLTETSTLVDNLAVNQIEKLAEGVAETRDSGRLFILSVGGSAGHAANEMEPRAKYIAARGDNVCVKIPALNTSGASAVPRVRRIAGLVQSLKGAMP